MWFAQELKMPQYTEQVKRMQITGAELLKMVHEEDFVDTLGVDDEADFELLYDTLEQIRRGTPGGESDGYSSEFAEEDNPLAQTLALPGGGGGLDSGGAVMLDERPGVAEGDDDVPSAGPLSSPMGHGAPGHTDDHAVTQEEGACVHYVAGHSL